MQKRQASLATPLRVRPRWCRPCCPLCVAARSRTERRAARGGHTATRLGRAIYVFGGADRQQNYCDNLYRLCTESLSWSLVQVGCPPSCPRSWSRSPVNRPALSCRRSEAASQQHGAGIRLWPGKTRAYSSLAA